MSKLSAMTIMPRESQTSICIVEGILCAVRMASHPMSFISFICRISAALFTAAPSGPRSWCRHTPFILRDTPLRRKPPSFDTSTVRTPRFVTVSSITLWSLYSLARTL